MRRRRKKRQQIRSIAALACVAVLLIGCGILAGKNLARRLQGKAPLILPRETMMGALAAYISSAPTENFQPMGANMGILPDLPERIRGKQEKYQAYADRGMAALEQYLRDAEQ